MAAHNKPRSRKIGKRPTATFVRSILDYAPATGVFTWKVNRPAMGKKEAEAGSRKKDGRLEITINQRHYRAAHIAWLCIKGKWPTTKLDHKDGSAKNNKWENIRKATHAQNMRNSKKRAHSTQPYKGVKKHHRRWIARIVFNRKELYLGLFSTAKKAHRAYCIAAIKFHKQFARFA